MSETFDVEMSLEPDEDGCVFFSFPVQMCLDKSIKEVVCGILNLMHDKMNSWMHRDKCFAENEVNAFRKLDPATVHLDKGIEGIEGRHRCSVMCKTFLIRRTAKGFEVSGYKEDAKEMDSLKQSIEACLSKKE